MSDRIDIVTEILFAIDGDLDAKNGNLLRERKRRFSTRKPVRSLTLDDTVLTRANHKTKQKKEFDNNSTLIQNLVHEMLKTDRCVRLRNEIEEAATLGGRNVARRLRPSRREKARDAEKLSDRFDE